MKRNPFLEDFETLLALAEGMANIIDGRQAEFGIAPETEALLRAAIAAAAFARDADLAIREAARESPEARRFLVLSETRRNRTAQQLRRRVSNLIAKVCLRMDDHDLTDVAEYVMSVST